ncbi:MAG: hypothetical protein J6S09_07640 [Paludibacteraceae bacterium]|nr:hypothetical protein [Paludibacteraceae bacterium]
MATPLTEIILPIAQKNESNKRKSTSQQTFPINEIFAVTSPEGTGGKGALIYIANRKEPLQTAQTFSYKDWQTEIERIDEETGEGIYIYAFKQITPRLMVNLLAIKSAYLDRDHNRLYIPPKENDLYISLDKEQFAILTKEVAHAGSDNIKRFLSLSKRLQLPKLSNETAKKIASKLEDPNYRSPYQKMEETHDLIFACLFIVFIFTLINIALSIAILCIVA